MKICITSQGASLDSPVDPRFGRCAYLIIVDPQTMDFEIVDNTGMQEGGGAGIRTGQLLSDKKVSAVITGNVGPNAFQVLSAAKIAIFTGNSGLVKDVTMKYKNGGLTPADKATVESHSGMK
jgi:predicted Fe-Mo cluster-binding NifX family protein